jgi:hypothetical protein
MFDKMRYVLEPPVSQKGGGNVQISDSNGNVLGKVSWARAMKPVLFSFEDTYGIRSGEVRSGLEIFDSLGVLQARILDPAHFRFGSTYKFGSYLLTDPTGREIAHSSGFSVQSSLFESMTRSKYEAIRKDSLSISSPKGEAIAIVHSNTSSSGLLIDIYPSQSSQLLILGLIATIVLA